MISKRSMERVKVKTMYPVLHVIPHSLFEPMRNRTGVK